MSKEFEHIMNNLYIVSTPIGNLQDITIRAIKTLFSVDYILAENPDRVRILLSEIKNRFGKFIDNGKNPRVIHFNEYLENENTHEFLSLLEKGFDVAIVSSAGTPLISDPGYKLVKLAISKNVNIIGVPGPSSVISSIVVSGLPTDKFWFSGFLPKTKIKKEKMLILYKEILNFSANKDINPTLIMFESPHRLIETLHSIKDVFGNINIVIAREMTKKFEELERKNIDHFIEKYEVNEPKGEFVILLNLKSA